MIIPMAKPRIFLTRLLPDRVMRELKNRFQLRYNRHDRPLSKKEIIEGARTADALISMLSDAIDRKVIYPAHNLKMIANYAVGYNNIDIHTATERNIAVTNTPGVLTETTADLTFGLLLAAARRIPEAERMLRSGKWTGWAPTQLLGTDLYGKTLGIIGMGRIGQAVARRAIGFSMRTLYHSRHRLSPLVEKRLKATFFPLSRLLRDSDFLSLHLPLTDHSRHLIDEKALDSMKPTAFLINTSRGAIVDEAALIRALAEKKIAGAGLDVFEREPHLSRRLAGLKNVVLLPHVGSASTETRARMGMMVVENLSAVFSGKRPPNMVN
jgi:glyoxylate reductase